MSTAPPSDAAPPMVDRVRSFDWSATPVGPPDRWPRSLRGAVDLCLHSRFPMMIWWGPDLTMVYNDAYAPMLGKRHPAALGRSGRDVWAEIWPEIEANVRAVVDRGESTFNDTVRLVMERNGYPEETWFTYGYSPILNDDGTVGGLFNACREETARVLAERDRDRLAFELADAKLRTDLIALQRLTADREALLVRERTLRAEAEHAGRMKDEFLANLSHELRTPLSAILGWAQILNLGGADGGADAETLAEGVQAIERNARAQTRIIDDLLDMSRIISGKVSINAGRIDLRAVVDAAVGTVRPAAAAKGIAVRLTTAAADGRHPVLADPNRLQQVFWNLLSNAVKFTPKGGEVRVHLDRGDSRTQSQWRATVTDTGEGIEAEFLPFVFDRFRQADASTTRRHGGLGLGLAIVKQLVELHGGSVAVHSGGRGTGSTFTVALPMSLAHHDLPHHPGGDGAAAGGVDPAAAAARSAQVTADWEAACGEQLAGAKAVIVDDEPDARAVLARILARCRMTVFAAATADEAIALVSRERPAILVSDVGMPGEDGYALIRRLRALPEDQGGRTPAVALTAYARAEDRMTAVRAGFQQHVPKPVEPAELITMVASLVPAPAREPG